MRGTVPAEASHNRTTSATQCAHNEHTKPHRNTEAECTRWQVTHVSDVGLVKSKSWMKTDTSSVQYNVRGGSGGKINEREWEAQPEELEQRTVPLYTAWHIAIDRLIYIDGYYFFSMIGKPFGHDGHSPLYSPSASTGRSSSGFGTSAPNRAVCVENIRRNNYSRGIRGLTA